ncbi:N-acetyltransferase family protein [Streptomyces cucumeris]|uniref:GNAT family N-acetyltransferase n=1 Tax=Streptomyces cucumeris TaxID=2962890 RepID=UPI003D70DCEC
MSAAGASGLALEPFGPELLGAAAELLAARHRRDREGEPALDERHTSPAACAELLRRAWDDGARGAVALRGGAVVGYLLARTGEGQRGRHCWSQLQDAAYAPDEGPVVLQRLYAHLSGPWVADGRLHHYTVAPAADLSSWLALVFAHEQVHALLDLPGDMAEERPPSGVRRAVPADIGALEPLLGLVNAAHTAPPVFAFTDQSMWDVLRPGHLELLNDPDVAYWIAEGNGGVDGFLVMRPVPAEESSLVKPRGSVELMLAATAPHARGSGIGTRLSRWALADAAHRGFTVCASDWRAANPLSSVFWPRRGFRPAAYRLHRVLDPRLTGPEHVAGP